MMLPRIVTLDQFIKAKGHKFIIWKPYDKFTLTESSLKTESRKLCTIVAEFLNNNKIKVRTVFSRHDHKMSMNSQQLRSYGS